MSRDKVVALLARTLFHALVLYALIAFYGGSFQLLNAGGTTFIRGKAWSIAALLALFLWGASLPRVRELISRYIPTLPLIRFPRQAMNPDLFILAMIVVLCSDYTQRKFVFYALYARSVSPTHIFECGVAAAVLLHLAARYLVTYYKTAERFFFPCLVLIQLLLTYSFLNYAEGRLIYSDDHPAFLYRLQLLMANFPRLPFYNPGWNAGVEARDFFSTGVLGIFFLSWPLLKWWGSFDTLETARVYTLIIPYLFIFMVPWAIYAASRLLQFSRGAAFIAALLALGPSAFFFEWLLKFGTLAFVMSAGLSPLVLALCLRIALLERRSQWPDVLATSVICTFCFFWPLAIVIFLPFLCYLILKIRTVLSPSHKAQVLTLAVLIALFNLPWITTWLREIDLAGYLARPSLPGASATHVAYQKKPSASDDHSDHSPNKIERNGMGYASLQKKFWMSLSPVNPLVFFLAFPGLFLLRSRDEKIVFGATIFWLLLLTALAPALKPQLELRRMILPAAFLMSVLAGAASIDALKRHLENGAKVRGISVALAASTAFLAGLLGAIIITPVNVRATYRNASDHHYVFAEGSISRLVEAIGKNGGNGRTFFLGFVLHEAGSSANAGVDGGHIAPFARFAGKPLYASHFVHARWSAVDPIPRSYLRRDFDGVEEFLDLVNATAVVTFRREWRKYCEAHPDRYQLVYEDKNLWMFTRPESGYFLSGSGKVLNWKDDSVELVPSESQIVLKFRYQPELQVSPSGSAKISSVPAFAEDHGGGREEAVSFVKLEISPEALSNKTIIRFGYRP